MIWWRNGKECLMIAAIISAVLGVAGWVAWSVHTSRELAILERGLPPGYTLECDGDGNYRAVWEYYWGDRCLAPRDSRAKAVYAAWLDYEKYQKMQGQRWNKVDEGGCQ